MEMRITATVPVVTALMLAAAGFDACARGRDDLTPSAGGGAGAPQVGPGSAGGGDPTIGGTAVGGSGGVGVSSGTGEMGGAASTGTGGSGGTFGSGGDAGNGSAGVGGAVGSGGAAGTNGTAGVGGAAGSGGNVGAAGAGGNGGVAGASGATGAAGSGGAAGGAGTGTGGAGGAAGMAGAAGNAGTAGNGGNAGASGAAGGDGGVVDAAVDRVVLGHPVCAVGACKLVFVTTALIDGNEGSAAALDTLCQTTAVARNIVGTWRAWASAPNSSPASRFTQATVAYRLLDGSTIANNWADLVDGVLAHSINVLEDGTIAPASEVWTGTMTTGAVASFTCNGWTTNSAAVTGIVGRTDLANVGWTFQAQEFCNLNLRVYCFEQ